MLVLILIFWLHFVGDFVFQSREMGKKKSEEFKWLFKHLRNYGLVMFAGLFLAGVDLRIALIYVGINLLLHGFQDWNIWKGYKAYATFKASDLAMPETYPYWEDKLFYMTIGLDQLLHYTVLLLTYVLMSGPQ